MGAVVTFDYAALSAEVAAAATKAAERIRVRMARSAADIIEIGRELIEQKGALGHGRFLAWIEAEFGMSRQTAERFMNVAEHLSGSNVLTLSTLTPTALYELAAPSTPDEVRAEVQGRVEAGETVSAVEVKRLKAEAAELKRAVSAAEKRAADATATVNVLAAEKTDLERRLGDRAEQVDPAADTGKLERKLEGERQKREREQQRAEALRNRVTLLEEENTDLLRQVRKLLEDAEMQRREHSTLSTMQVDDVETQVAALRRPWAMACDRARQTFLAEVSAETMETQNG